ncbi:MAG: clostripain [Bacteroides sp.]|nr:clostripain [Bacteroides sp.]
MKKILALLLCACLFSACQKENDEEPDSPSLPDNSITILSYLIANNNLDSYLKDNIVIMYDGLATMKEKATLLVYWDGKSTIGANNADHLILEFKTDGKGNINGRKALDISSSVKDVLNEAKIVKEYPSQVSTSKEVMTQVIGDMISASTSTKFGLVFGSHGSSWLNSIITSRALGYDGAHDNFISLDDIVEALETVGQKYEFILFDACYMGTTEVCYSFKDLADYQIVSAMEVPAYGFPYNLFMNYLCQGTVSGYEQVCKAYIDFYNELLGYGESAWGTIALIDSKEVQSLTDAIREEIVEHKETLAEYSPTHLQNYGRNSGPYIAYDLGHLMKDLNEGTIPAAFNTQLEKTVLYKGCMTKSNPSNYKVDESNYSGLGIYIPVSARPKWNTYFKTLDWFTASGWNEVTFSWEF